MEARSESSDGARAGRPDSWKKIAVCLRQGIRTVQLWEG